MVLMQHIASDRSLLLEMILQMTSASRNAPWGVYIWLRALSKIWTEHLVFPLLRHLPMPGQIAMLYLGRCIGDGLI